jgi:hypothetical protein
MQLPLSMDDGVQKGPRQAFRLYQHHYLATGWEELEARLGKAS